MKKLLLVILPLTALLSRPLCAHRLDEYLQATILAVHSDRIEGTIRLVPGVAVASSVIANIDSDGNGIISNAEQRSYAIRVLGDLSLRIDDTPAALHLVSSSFPSRVQMAEGVGEIEIKFWSMMPRGGTVRYLTFENDHRRGISVYLVNALMPDEPQIRILQQSRNETESYYRLDFTVGAASPIQTSSWNPSGFSGAFRLGMHHIAAGTDHLLFLLTLLLPAPLLATAGRWSGRATVRQSLMHILGIVTAFTLGHSFTLALATSGQVHIPSAPIEILIAVSILICAGHSIRPLLPGREPLLRDSLDSFTDWHSPRLWTASARRGGIGSSA